MSVFIVKASRVANLTDARYFAAMEVDYLGFNLEEGTEDYLEPMYMKAIREWVEGPRIVGEFSHATPAFAKEAAAFFGLDAVQIAAAGHDLSVLAGTEVLLEVSWNDDTAAMEAIFRENQPYVRYFLLLLGPHQWPATKTLLADWCARYPILLECHLEPDVVREVLALAQPAGLTLRGGAEEKVGVKSFDELEEVFEVLGKN